MYVMLPRGVSVLVYSEALNKGSSGPGQWQLLTDRSYPLIKCTSTNLGAHVV